MNNCIRSCEHCTLQFQDCCRGTGRQLRWNSILFLLVDGAVSEKHDRLVKLSAVEGCVHRVINMVMWYKHITLEVVLSSVLL